MPKGQRRNPFQALLDTAEKQLQLARERLSSAEHHADCIHQKKLRAARTEHDEWTKMVRSLRTSLTIPQPPKEPEVYDPHERVGKDGEVPGIPATKKQSNNGAELHIEPEAHGPHGQPDAGDRLKKPGPRFTGKKPGKVSHFDRCPGLPNRGKCLNSKPFDSELCGRCAAMKNVEAWPR